MLLAVVMVMLFLLSLQTCFLSSIDIHTQCGYQTMLEEAVAIVMAPTDPTGKRCGIFRLSTPGGLTLVQVSTSRQAVRGGPALGSTRHGVEGYVHLLIKAKLHLCLQTHALGESAISALACR